MTALERLDERRRQAKEARLAPLASPLGALCPALSALGEALAEREAEREAAIRHRRIVRLVVRGRS